MSKKPSENARKEALRRWSETPSVNPRYKGATPADMVRALLRTPRNKPLKGEHVMGDEKTPVSSDPNSRFSGGC